VYFRKHERGKKRKEKKRKEKKRKEKKRKEKTKPTLPIGNSLSKHFQLVLPSTSEMINEIITHDLSSQTIFPLESGSSALQRGWEFDQSIPGNSGRTDWTIWEREFLFDTSQAEGEDGRECKVGVHLYISGTASGSSQSRWTKWVVTGGVSTSGAVFFLEGVYSREGVGRGIGVVYM
jgi:hypothetical protein